MMYQNIASYCIVHQEVYKEISLKEKEEIFFNFRLINQYASLSTIQEGPLKGRSFGGSTTTYFTH